MIFNHFGSQNRGQPIARKNMRKIRGTSASNELTGNKKRNRMWGYEGDDVFFPNGGMDKVWGGPGDDTIVISPGKGYVMVMDMQRGDVIDVAVAVTPEDCPTIVIEKKSNSAWISNSKSSDVYAFVRGYEADWLEIDLVMMEVYVA